MTEQKGNHGGAESLPSPTRWPSANERLLGLGVGLPVQPLDRLAQFSALDFERFTLEWATGYLASELPGVYEVQQRGGAGDKGRDIVVWFEPPETPGRRWSLYQCKHYDARLGAGAAAVEIAKVLYYTFSGHYTKPSGYWFVTHLGVTSDLQDLLDEPARLKTYILENWVERCSARIIKGVVTLTDELRAHIDAFDFSIFRAKQPLDLINEHAKTRYHLIVFGAPLIDRTVPTKAPSQVAPGENGYLNRLYEAIGQALGISVSSSADFAHDKGHSRLFDRSRITFYCAENLKELASDRMADARYFETLLNEFENGLFYSYTKSGLSGIERLAATVLSAQAIQLGGHVLAPHVLANDREGMCHQLANERGVSWCIP
ncbi:ABC-three component system protein [Luteibacter sp. dw_328]|uniref:ABC-three component system protein n=1 Tax=Luteibacter sp. dw_328 TaxID=2719796 RepID=UPI001BD54214|nr:ABC-three component system protein [Luteibacter sp. dw_328]